VLAFGVAEEKISRKASRKRSEKKNVLKQKIKIRNLNDAMVVMGGKTEVYAKAKHIMFYFLLLAFWKNTCFILLGVSVSILLSLLFRFEQRAQV
jgi:hypothetical protein